jgi:Arc/MetJ-type ribon-helix-helix transcriptional regulator
MDRMKTTTRVQLELPDASMERLKALREKTEASSYAEVIKNSLRLYEALIKEAESGKEVCIRDSSGAETTYTRIF